MPWCPKCKSEYREGFSVCADCGSELVDEERFRELEAQQLAAEAAQLFEADAIEFAQEPEPEKAVEEPAETEETVEQPKRPAASGPSGALYQDSTERANENRSSAWILLAMGSVGIIAMALGIMGVLPLNFGNPYLFYGVMSAVFILFVVAGAVSMKNARIFDKKAESENSLRDTMLAWCRENLHADALDKEIGADGSESEEALYFKRFESIRARLNYQFVNLDQGFLERFIDDCVYDMVFESKEES